MNEETKYCDKCGRVATKQCGGCGDAFYCSESCAQQDYIAGHSSVCLFELCGDTIDVSLRRFIPFVTDFQHAIPNLFETIMEIRRTKKSQAKSDVSLAKKLELLHRELVKSKMMQRNDDAAYQQVKLAVQAIVAADDASLSQTIQTFLNWLLERARGHSRFTAIYGSNIANQADVMAQAIKAGSKSNIQFTGQAWGKALDTHN
jgi:hypothetical protein